MPDVTHLPAALTGPSANASAQRNNGARAAQNNAGPKDAGARQAEGADQERSFSAVLEEQCAPADSAATEETTAKGEETALAAEAAVAAQLPAEPPVLSIDALIAARLAALRPEGAAAVAGNGKGEGLSGAGRDGTELTEDPRASLSGVGERGERDARRPAAAGVLGATDTAKAAITGKEGAADAVRNGGGDFSALIGRLRQEGSANNAAATQAADNPISTLSMLMPATPITETAPAAATRPTTLIEAPVGSPLFADEAAQRVTWLAKNGIEHAEIRVTPADMGPIQVSIDMSQNEASINFVVAQADTRVALEDSLHRLEEMLADSGIALAQANVGQQDPGQSQSGREPGGRAAGTGRADGKAGAEGIGGPAMQAAAPRPGAVRGLVDTFA